MERGEGLKEIIDLRSELSAVRRLADEYRKLAERLRTRTDLLSLALANVWQKLAETKEYKGKIDPHSLDELNYVRDPRPMLVELLTEVVMLEEELKQHSGGKRQRNARPGKNGDRR